MSDLATYEYTVNFVFLKRFLKALVVQGLLDWESC